jgi:hypothetical protein
MIHIAKENGGVSVEVKGKVDEIGADFMIFVHSLVEKNIFPPEMIIEMAHHAIADARTKNGITKERLREIISTETGRKAVNRFMEDLSEVINDVENE